eukprot:bmy_05018T0
MCSELCRELARRQGGPGKAACPSRRPPHPAPGWEAGITPVEGSPAPETLATAAGPRGRVWGSGLAPGQLGDGRTWPDHARDARWVGGGNKKQSARQLLFPRGPGALGKPRKAVWTLTQNKWGRVGVTPWLTPKLCATAAEAVVLSSGSFPTRRCRPDPTSQRCRPDVRGREGEASGGRLGWRRGPEQHPDGQASPLGHRKGVLRIEGPQAQLAGRFLYALGTEAERAELKITGCSGGTCEGRTPPPPSGTAAATPGPPGTFWEHFLLLLLPSPGEFQEVSPKEVGAGGPEPEAVRPERQVQEAPAEKGAHVGRCHAQGAAGLQAQGVHGPEEQPQAGQEGGHREGRVPTSRAPPAGPAQTPDGSAGIGFGGEARLEVVGLSPLPAPPQERDLRDVGDWRKNIEEKSGMEGRKKMFESES